MKGYSPLTIKVYQGHAKRFIEQCSKPFQRVTSADVHRYILELLQLENSHSYVYQAISALRFWFYYVGKRSDFPSRMERPKKEQTLPTVLSASDVLRLLNAVSNLKHRTMLTLVYSSGLRISEVVKLKRGDIDFTRNMILIRQSKGKKDRYTVLAKDASKLLKQFLEKETTHQYLFPGNQIDRPLTARSLQYSFEKAKRRASIQQYKMRIRK